MATATRMPSPKESAPQSVSNLSTNTDAATNDINNGNVVSMNSNNSKIESEPQFFVNTDLSVEKSIVNELLLVCGVIGSTVDTDTQQMVPVEDCLNWLQDLQRALRRDDDAHRPISLLLGKWKVLQQKLLPLVLSCRYDTPLVLTVVKFLSS